MAEGIRVTHRTERSRLHVVEVLDYPYPGGPMLCPTCRIAHVYKAIHLWLDDTGSCTVAYEVLDLLKRAGMPDLETTGIVPNPPTLTVGRPESRQVQDFANRTIRQWSNR